MENAMNEETRELLTLAAKAMGFTVLPPYTYYDWLVIEKGDSPSGYWNPLIDADDLVEMECQLEIGIEWYSDIINASHDTRYRVKNCSEPISNHPTRRAARAMASLRVAAEIGRRMV